VFEVEVEVEVEVVGRHFADHSTPLHHSMLTDCQRSEKIRSTAAAAATNQLSW